MKHGESVYRFLFCKRTNNGEIRWVGVCVAVLQENGEGWNTGSHCICSSFAGKHRTVKHWEPVYVSMFCRKTVKDETQWVSVCVPVFQEFWEGWKPPRDLMTVFLFCRIKEDEHQWGNSCLCTCFADSFTVVVQSPVAYLYISITANNSGSQLVATYTTGEPPFFPLSFIPLYL